MNFERGKKFIDAVTVNRNGGKERVTRGRKKVVIVFSENAREERVKEISLFLIGRGNRRVMIVNKRRNGNRVTTEEFNVTK